jgi:hypothetical protein
MAKLKETVKVGEGTQFEQKQIALENVSFPQGIGEVNVKMKATDKHKFHSAGKEFMVHKAHAQKLEDKGWATIVGCLIILCMCSFSSYSQVSFKNDVYRTKLTDTTVNTATGLVYARAAGSGVTTTVQAVFTKISGTAAGTVTLMGSVDGINFDTAKLPDSNTALPTYTVTDVASQTYTWRLTGVPYLHYKIRHVGTGTMSVAMGGTVVVR